MPSFQFLLFSFTNFINILEKNRKANENIKFVNIKLFYELILISIKMSK